MIIKALKNSLSFKFLFLFVTILLAENCSNDTRTLQNLITKYYIAEKNGDWEKVYSFRTDSFRKSVVKNEFTTTMRDSSKGWTLIKFEIENIQLNGNTAKAKISFTEKPPAKFWVGSGMRESDVSSTANMLWVKERNTWHCKRSPSRLHLPYTE